ncbi:NAD(P)/FAD-dependent oxidoreductase [Wukongibacter sp. M2B1]|uniref:NAD(P)/FAD-dependent oxidoreductase n=1 Tax=Wukongibacter sp. M2B1 TaxID=3088895 RepID=UPI003D796DD9
MRYVILGASASGVNCAKTIRELDPNGQITMVSGDENIYSRCMLHHVIGEKRSIEEINFVKKIFSQNYKIDWMKKVKAIGLNIRDKKVALDNGKILEYDKLLIATGSSSFIPPVKNLREGKEIYGLRNIEDAIRIKEKAKKAESVVVLGGGLVGIDAITGLLEHDLKVSLVEMSDRILPMQLDRRAASKYERLFEKEGAKIYTSVGAEEVVLDEENRVKAVRLSDGRLIDCELIVVATGVRPNVDFIEDNTIVIDRGIVINSRGETNIKDVYAAGDVTGKSPIWPLAVKQGIVAAHNMVGKSKKAEKSFSLRNSMNFLGLQTVSLGLIEAPNDSYHVSIEEYGDSYKKMIHRDGIIYGAVVQGDISYCGVLTHLIKNRLNISHIEKDIFDINYSDFFRLKENGEYEYSV